MFLGVGGGKCLGAFSAAQDFRSSYRDLGDAVLD